MKRKRVDDGVRDVANEKKHQSGSKDELSCDTCGKQLSTRKILKRHVKTHTNIRPFPCDFDGCTKSFTNKSNMERHRNGVHLGVRPYTMETCPVCKAEVKSYSLKGHLETHNEQKVYHCNVEGCQQTFKTRALRDTHTRRCDPNAERKHKCPVEGCDKSFIFSPDLKRHLDTHRDERDYKCDGPECGCGKTFRRKTHLKEHITRHLGIKNFKCDFKSCGKAFVSKFDLKLHQYIHTDSKPFPCQEESCGKSYVTQYLLKLHFQSWHTEEGQRYRKKSEMQLEQDLKQMEIALMGREYHFTRDSDEHCPKTSRVDFLIDRDGFWIILENDEHQHRSIPLLCEISRMADINTTAVCETKGEKFMLFVRYNPDKFTVDGKERRLTRQERLALLENVLKNFKPTRPLEIVYICYDVVNGRLALLSDSDFPEELKEFVTAVY